MPLTRHLPVNDPLVTLRETLVNNQLNNPVFKSSDSDSD